MPPRKSGRLPARPAEVKPEQVVGEAEASSAQSSRGRRRRGTAEVDTAVEQEEASSSTTTVVEPASRRGRPKKQPKKEKRGHPLSAKSSEENSGSSDDEDMKRAMEMSMVEFKPAPPTAHDDEEEDDPDLAQALRASMEEPLIKFSGTLVAAGGEGTRSRSEEDLQEALRRSLMESEEQERTTEDSGKEALEVKASLKNSKLELATIAVVVASSSSSSPATAVEPPRSPTSSLYYDAPDTPVKEPEKSKPSKADDAEVETSKNIPASSTVFNDDDFDDMCTESPSSLKQRLSQSVIEISPEKSSPRPEVAGPSSSVPDQTAAPSTSSARDEEFAAQEERARAKAALLERCDTPEEEYEPENSEDEDEHQNSEDNNETLNSTGADSSYHPTPRGRRKLKEDNHSFLFPDQEESSDDEAVSTTVPNRSNPILS